MGENESKENKVIHIKDWPEGDRFRETRIERKIEALSDEALLAILLEGGRKGESAAVLAREMLNEVGGFGWPMSSKFQDLRKTKDMDKAKIAQIVAAMEIVRRQLRQSLERSSVIQNPDGLLEYLKVTMGNLSREEFRVLHLSRSRQLIADEFLVEGTADPASERAREIVEDALKRKAAALILAHHHPADLPMASDEDFALTRALVKASWAVDISVIDHIIIGKNGFLSMKRHRPEIFEGEDEIA